MLSITQTKGNSDDENDLIDLHFAFWTVLVMRSLFKVGNVPLLLKVHHMLGSVSSIFFRSLDIGGTFCAITGVLAECLTCLVSVAGLLRIYHEIVMPMPSGMNGGKSQLFLRLSNVLFMLFLVFFGYLRMYVFSKVSIPMLYEVVLQRGDDSSPSPVPGWFRAYIAVMWPVALMMGYWWSYRAYKRFFKELLAKVAQARK